MYSRSHGAGHCAHCKHKENKLMKPFVLKQHDKDFASMRDLRNEELIAVYGGLRNSCPSPDDKTKLNTVTTTANGDGGDDGCDEG